MGEKFSYRPATLNDIPLLACHHRMMFEEMREVNSNNQPKESCCSPTDSLVAFPIAVKKIQAPDFGRLESAQRENLKDQLADGTCKAWLAEYKGDSVASGTVTFVKNIPVPEDLSLNIALLHSVYTSIKFRGRGIASTLLDRLLEECREKGIRRVQLNSSEAGRGVYLGKGFIALKNTMLLWL